MPARNHQPAGEAIFHLADLTLDGSDGHPAGNRADAPCGSARDAGGDEPAADEARPASPPARRGVADLIVELQLLEARIRGLIGRLGAPEYSERQNASEQLERLRRIHPFRVLAELIPYLDDPDAEVRFRVTTLVRALLDDERVRNNPDAALLALASHLEQRRPRARRAVQILIDSWIRSVEPEQEAAHLGREQPGLTRELERILELEQRYARAIRSIRVRLRLLRREIERDLEESRADQAAARQDPGRAGVPVRSERAERRAARRDERAARLGDLLERLQGH